MAHNITPDRTGADEPSLERSLGLTEATTLIIGGIIGASIFLIPAAVADEAGSPLLALAAWAISGVIAVTSALCFAELSAAYPYSGGTYVFLKKAYPHTPLAFLFAWMMFFAYATGAIAVVAMMAANYSVQLLGEDARSNPWISKGLAILLILTLTLINYIGVRLGAMTQNVLTSVKVVMMVVLIAAAFLLGPPLPDIGSFLMPADAELSGLGGLSSAIVLCLFSYSGAAFITHVAEEVKSPERNIPRAIIISMLVVIALYMLINIAYFSVLPFNTVRTSSYIASDMMVAVVGDTGARIVSVTVLLSAIAVVNAQLLNYPRITYAVARDGLFFSRLARIHPVRRAPTDALLLIGCISALFVLVGSYRDILIWAGFVVHVFTCLTVAAVIVLRVRQPDLPRPYRVLGYPLTPVVFLAISAWYLTDLVSERPLQCLVGVGIVAAGIPFYIHWRRQALRRQLIQHTEHD